MKPGRDLDALIAEKIFEDTGLRDALADNTEWGMNNHYSTDIADAFEVVEALRSQGFTFVLGTFESKNGIPMVPTSDMRAMFAKVNQRVVMVPGDSPAHAICMAALEALYIDFKSNS